MHQPKGVLGFTLVELIVVITIVGILSTVGFVSYSGYLTGARDSNRISQLTKLSDSLQVYAATKNLPLPDDYIEVTASGTVIGYQGYVGVDVLETIDFTNGGKDPKDDSYYTYYLSKDRNSMQLLALMEEQGSVAKLNANKAHAATYEDRYPKVYGKKMGVLTQVDTNTPAQEVTGVTTVDIVATTDNYIAHISDTEKLEGAGSVLQAAIPNGNCKRIKQMGKSRGNGTYTVNPAGGGDFNVYCDMETEGGGWTAATMLADMTTQNLFDTGNTTKITSITNDISTKGTISDIWKDNQSKDIMLKCFTDNDIYKKYETPFFIYNFIKNDIGNLEKNEKQSTVFSSHNLSGSWGNNTFTFDTTYLFSSGEESFYIGITPDESCFMLGASHSFHIKNGNAGGTSNILCPSFSSDIPDNSSASHSFDTENYCISFIK